MNLDQPPEPKTVPDMAPFPRKCQFCGGEVNPDNACCLNCGRIQTGPAIDYHMCVCGRCGNSHHPGRSAEAFEPSTVPDVGLAIARQLQAAAALVGPERVVQFFRNATKQIVGHRLGAVDISGIVNDRCQKDMAELINQLLTQQ